MNMNMNDSDKKRISEFVKDNDLNLTIIESDIFRYSISTDDNHLFQPYMTEEGYLLVKINCEKMESQKYNSGVQAHEYLRFSTLSHMLEHLAAYDRNIYRTRWFPIMDSIQIPFHSEGYSPEWFEGLSEGNWVMESEGNYDKVVWVEKRPVSVHSPFNTLHEVSWINQYSPSKLESLYFEIHPISLAEKKESYLVKILSNTDPIIQDWINYKVDGKKGLSMFIEEMFSNRLSSVKFESDI
jgi:hypothetical protein